MTGLQRYRVGYTTVIMRDPFSGYDGMIRRGLSPEEAFRAVEEQYSGGPAAAVVRLLSATPTGLRYLERAREQWRLRGFERAPFDAGESHGGDGG